jgi:hypothetical protein
LNRRKFGRDKVVIGRSLAPRHGGRVPPAAERNGAVRGTGEIVREDQPAIGHFSAKGRR